MAFFDPRFHQGFSHEAHFLGGFFEHSRTQAFAFFLVVPLFFPKPIGDWNVPFFTLYSGYLLYSPYGYEYGSSTSLLVPLF